MKRSNESGMGLIEIVVAITITMIITAPLVSIYSSATKKIQILATGNAYNLQSLAFSRELINDVSFSQEIYGYAADANIYGCDGPAMDFSSSQVGSWSFSPNSAFKKTLFKFSRFDKTIDANAPKSSWESNISKLRQDSFYYLMRTPEAKSLVNGRQGFFRLLKVRCDYNNTRIDFKSLDLGDSLCSSSTNPNSYFIYNSALKIPANCNPIDAEGFASAIDSLNGRNMITFVDGTKPQAWPLRGTRSVNINLPIGDSLPKVFGTLESLTSGCNATTPSNLRPLCRLPRYFT